MLEAVDLGERKSASPFAPCPAGRSSGSPSRLRWSTIPTVIFLDEPTTGLDPQARRLMWDLAKTWKREGRTVILTTHYMEEAEELCDRVAVMDSGKIIAMDLAGDADRRTDFGRGFHREHEVRLATLEDVFLDLTGRSRSGVLACR